MASLMEYYGRSKSGFGSMHPRDMTQLGEDWLITAAAGAGVGLVSASIGGLDKTIAGVSVPVDGLIAIGLGFAGLQMGGDTGKMLKIASIAAGGSAAVRTFEAFFKRGLKVKGEFEELGSGSGWQLGAGGPLPQFGPGVGFGNADQDRLVAAARYL